MQSDQHVSTEALQTEMREVEKRLEALQHRGVELEKNLRDCRNGADNYSPAQVPSYCDALCVNTHCVCPVFAPDKEEERMLMEWFSLLHEKQALVHRDTELLHL